MFGQIHILLIQKSLDSESHTVNLLGPPVDGSAVIVVEDMKYLARGGRISPAKAKIGNLMNIKPVLTVQSDGTLGVGSKQNGLKKAYNYIVEEFKNKYKQIDGAAVTIVDADNSAAADDIEKRLLEIAPDAKIWRQPIGPVIGVHAGPGTIGIIFTTK